MLLGDKDKIDYVVKVYLRKCRSGGMYVNGKPIPDYYKLKRYFMANKKSLLAICYRYARTMICFEEMSFEDFIRNAILHNRLTQACGSEAFDSNDKISGGDSYVEEV